MNMKIYKDAASPTAVYAGIGLLVASFIIGPVVGEYPPAYMIAAIAGMIGVRMGARAYQNGKKAESGKDFS